MFDLCRCYLPPMRVSALTHFITPPRRFTQQSRCRLQRDTPDAHAAAARTPPSHGIAVDAAQPPPRRRCRRVLRQRRQPVLQPTHRPATTPMFAPAYSSGERKECTPPRNIMFSPLFFSFAPRVVSVAAECKTHVAAAPRRYRAARRRLRPRASDFSPPASSRRFADLTFL